jgi:predicted TIM-barrel fold metal-dependent hydrolase
MGPDQVLFASDGPIYEPHVPNKRWVEIIQSLKDKDTDGTKFSDEEIKAILGGNACKVFKL